MKSARELAKEKAWRDRQNVKAGKSKSLAEKMGWKKNAMDRLKKKGK